MMDDNKYEQAAERSLAETPAESVAARIGAVALNNNLEHPEDTGLSSRDAAKKFLKSHGPALSLFAGDSSLKYETSPDARTFAFYPEEFKVEVPLSWFADEKYSDNELYFASCHEMAHFIDMRKNPDAFIDNFKEMEQRAKEATDDYFEAHRDSHTSRQFVENYFHNGIHTLYNVLDDIYVNNLVMSRIKYFDVGQDGHDAIESLYEKIGYGDADLTSLPLHEQMIYALIRDEMLGEARGKSIIDDGVEKVLSQMVLGKTIRERIDSELKPKQGLLVDPAERYRQIRVIIMPKYLELLKTALEEQEEADKQKRQNQQSESNEQNQAEGQEQRSQEEGREQSRADGQESSSQDKEESQNSGMLQDSEKAQGSDSFDNNSSNRFSNDILQHDDNWEQAIKEILNSFKETDKIDEMSEAERKEYLRKQRTREFDGKHGITEEQRRLNDEILIEIREPRREMRKFWKRLVGRSIEYRQERVPRQRRGRFNVGSFVKNYPNIVESERNGNLRELEIYDRNESERIEVEQPEAIEVSLLVDCSGSMYGEREAIARKTAALLMYSIKDFNDELGRSRSSLRVDTEVIAFGSEFKVVKPFNRQRDRDSDDANIINSLSEIDAERGQTYDNKPLSDISSRLSRDEKNRIEQKKLKKIVFEITDGAPTDAKTTKDRLEELSREGVIVVGFQIGNTDWWDRALFNEIWNQESTSNNRQKAFSNKKGIVIGENIAFLPEALMRELSGLLNGIII